MNIFLPLVLICVSTLLVILVIWLAMRLVRWARKGTKGGSLLGLGLALPSAGINPQPPPQVYVEQVKAETRRKKTSESGDPEN